MDSTGNSINYPSGPRGPSGHQFTLYNRQSALWPGIPILPSVSQAPGLAQPFPDAPPPPRPQFTRAHLPPLYSQLWELLTSAKEEEECEEAPQRQVPFLPWGLLSLHGAQD